MISWAARPPARILKLAMRGQVDHAMALLPKLALASFIRIDAPLDSPQGQRLELDNASAEALETLTLAGAGALTALPAHQRDRLSMMLGRRRAEMK
jgi:hypothetical protein